VEDPRITNTNEEEHEKQTRQGDEKMNNQQEWMKLWQLVTEFFELQNQFVKLRIQDLSEWMEHDCACPSCLKEVVESAWKDGPPSFDDTFKEEWE
jgi:hypothetical protein